MITKKRGELFVVDTNVFVSAYFLDSKNARELCAAVLHRGDLAFSKDTYRELEEKAKSLKFDKVTTSTYRHSRVRWLKDEASFFTPSENLDICRDPKDNMFFDIAREAKATAIISGDKDLHDAKERFPDCSVFTPNEARHLLGFTPNSPAPKKGILGNEDGAVSVNVGLFGLPALAGKIRDRLGWGSEKDKTAEAKSEKTEQPNGLEGRSKTDQQAAINRDRQKTDDKSELEGSHRMHGTARQADAGTSRQTNRVGDPQKDQPESMRDRKILDGYQHFGAVEDPAKPKDQVKNPELLGGKSWKDGDNPSGKAPNNTTPPPSPPPSGAAAGIASKKPPGGGDGGAEASVKDSTQEKRIENKPAVKMAEPKNDVSGAKVETPATSTPKAASEGNTDPKNDTGNAPKQATTAAESKKDAPKVSSGQQAGNTEVKSDMPAGKVEETPRSAAKATSIDTSNPKDGDASAPKAADTTGEKKNVDSTMPSAKQGATASSGETKNVSAETTPKAEPKGNAKVEVASGKEAKKPAAVSEKKAEKTTPGVSAPKAAVSTADQSQKSDVKAHSPEKSATNNVGQGKSPSVKEGASSKQATPIQNTNKEPKPRSPLVSAGSGQNKTATSPKQAPVDLGKQETVKTKRSINTEAPIKKATNMGGSEKPAKLKNSDSNRKKETNTPQKAAPKPVTKKPPPKAKPKPPPPPPPPPKKAPKPPPPPAPRMK